MLRLLREMMDDLEAENSWATTERERLGLLRHGRCSTVLGGTGFAGRRTGQENSGGTELSQKAE
jgi:hypothetical protein